MATLQRKNVGTPDETRSFPHGTFTIVRLGDLAIACGRFQPGWRWSEHVKPLVGTAAARPITWGISSPGAWGCAWTTGRRWRLDRGTSTRFRRGMTGGSSATSRWWGSRLWVPRPSPSRADPLRLPSARHTLAAARRRERGGHRMSTEEHKALVRRFEEEVWNGRNPSRVDELFPPRATSSAPPGARRWTARATAR